MQIGTYLSEAGVLIISTPVSSQELCRRVVASLGMALSEGPQAELTASLESLDRSKATFLPRLRLENLESPVVRAVLLRRGWVGHQTRARFGFVLLTPVATPDLHLQLLSRLEWLSRRPGLLLSVSSARNSSEVLTILKKAEAAGNGGFCSLSRQDVLAELASSPLGLSPEQALKRLQETGPNLLRHQKSMPPWLKLAKNFLSVFALMLWVAGGLCFLPGVDMPQLGWAIFTVIVVNAVFSFWQEFKAEKAVAALQRLMPPRAKVIRLGVMQVVNAVDLVFGDLILLEEGDLVPADSRLLEASELRVNNSSLTGESRPIYKSALELKARVADDFLWTELPNMVFAGTAVTSGSAKAVVTGTGMDTEVGKIARLTEQVRPELSPLQREMNTVVNVLTGLSLGIGMLFFALGVGVAGLSLFSAFIFTIGITVANIPEGLLPTLSLSLAMGVQRLSKRNVLVKHLAAVETLGSTTVICTDKTGTLTTNRVSVVDLFTLAPGPESVQLSRVAVLCNNARLNAGETLGDPTEGALLSWALETTGHSQGSSVLEFPRILHFPFESVRKRMSTVHTSADGSRFVCAKGAPAELLARCGGLSDGQIAEVTARMDEMASRGLRTLALAWRPLTQAEKLPQTAEEAETNLRFLGLTGMEDPPRPEVPQAMELCATAGIRLVMITGDYGLTAQAIAEQTGMTGPTRPGRFLSGADLERLDDAALDGFLFLDRAPLVFSRMSPEQKMRIVERFKLAQEVVAVTGDGVNDAAALKKADIGIAMGQGANDVAKEAADMLVLDGNFSSIVVAVEEGRAVYANIRRFVTYILASNMPELAPFVLFVLLRIPLALTVMQILAIDLGTDLVPALGLGVEPPEKGLMQRPPRGRTDRLIDLNVFLRSYLWLGGLEIVFSLGAFFWSYLGDGWLPGQVMPAEGAMYTKATTMTLAAIVFCQIGNVFACRTTEQSILTSGWTSNPLVLWGVGVELVLLVVLVNVPFFQTVFGLVALGPDDWLFLLVFPPLLLSLEELRKLVLRQSRRLSR